MLRALWGACHAVLQEVEAAVGDMSDSSDDGAL